MRSDEHCRLQRAERIALTRHAAQEGCKLIVNPFLKYEKYGELARCVRLLCFHTFLERTPQCEVAIHREMERGTSNTYVGDWFAAESVLGVAGKGYFQTIFTRHAASHDQIRGEFLEICEALGPRIIDSRKDIAKQINAIVKKLRKMKHE